MKWIAPTLVYCAVALGIFYFHSAWGALLGFHIAIVSSLLIARPNIPISILGKNHNRKWIVLSVPLCGSSGVALYFLWNYFGFGSDFSAQVQSLGLNSLTWLPFITYFALVNPFIEEYFWRGYLGNPARGFYGSDFLYAGFHALILMGKVPVGWMLCGLGVLVIAGWFWRQIMREDQGLLAPVLGHMAADFTILLAVYLNAQNLWT
jgi:membrane protease YdiL (CAAX protease family)